MDSNQTELNVGNNKIKTLKVKKTGKSSHSYVIRRRINTFFLHIVLIFWGLLTILPLAWMVSSSLKQSADIFLIPPKLLPNPIEWHNYADSWTQLPFGHAYINSFTVCGIILVFTLLTSSMAGYSFAKLRFPGKDIVFVLFLATMMVPFQVTMIPTFIIMKYMGLLDTLSSLIIPAMLCNAFGVFLLRQFIKGIPDELEESAILDGCNYWQIFVKIMLPLLKPPLAALGIFSFMGNWNNFMGPLIYLSSPDTFTVPLLLNQFRGLYTTNWELMMAAACIAIIPVLVAYIVGQKYIIEGITLTGMKA